MSRQVNGVRVLIASPGDLSEVRSLIPPLFTEWNSVGNRQAILTPIMWEHAALPEMGDHPQEVLDRQLVLTSDLLVAVFWTRIGTATQRHISGTIQEIQTFIEIKGPKRAMIYFIDKPINISPMKLDTAQLHQLQEYRKKIEKECLLCSVADESELKLRLYQHIDTKVNALLRNELPEPTRSQDTAGTNNVDENKWPCEPTVIGICSSFETYWLEMYKRGDRFRDEGGRLAARFALAIDRFLIENQFAISDADKHFLREQSHAMKKMHNDARTDLYRDAIPRQFWDDGKAIAERLGVHAKFMSTSR